MSTLETKNQQNQQNYYKINHTKSIKIISKHNFIIPKFENFKIFHKKNITIQKFLKINVPRFFEIHGP